MKTNKIILSLLLALFFPLASWAHNRLIINQVMYDTPLTEVASDKGAYNGEFIELYNAGAEDIELDEWGIISLSGKKQKEVSQFNNVIILSGGYYVFAIRRGNDNTFELKDLYTSIQSQTPVIEYQNKIILANAKETLYLLHNNDTIDQIICGSDTQLKAKNASNIFGNDCVSLHRIGVEFDENGKAIPNKSQWKTDKVSFSECQLPKRIYEDRTIISFDPSSTGTTSTANGNNYILTITPLDEVDTINVTKDGISIDGNVRANTAIQYYDGLGRPNELVAIGVTPRKRDLVSTTTYNGLHCATEQYLPTPMNTKGAYTDIATAQQKAKSYFGDNRPFTETLYENSALERVVGQKRPGQSYADHPASSKFELNTETDIRIYTVAADKLKADGNYAAYSLFKTTTKDEDGKGSVSVFTDKLGRKIMEERSGSRTYFVYDDLNRLRFVLPNLPQTKLTSGEFDLENATLKSTAYCYKYDGRGNMIYKRLPSCEPMYMVYDVMGQLVLKQDGNQRLKNEWLLFAYDSIGRNTYTAEVHMQQYYRDLIDKFANVWQVGNKTLTILGLRENDKQVLIENFYDNYDFTGKGVLLNESNLVPKPGYGDRYDNATGMLTCTRVRLARSGYKTTVFYYDDKGRVIQTYHTRSISGNDIINTYTKYNFDGTVAECLTEFIPSIETNEVTELYKYSYDHAGRLITTKYQLNDDPEITLSELSYDEIGHLAQNLLHNRKDTIRYSYDMRNMLTETNNKHFSEKLYYADIPSGALPNPNVTKCFNGNISAMTVGSEDDGFTSFLNTYDEQNRLTASFTHAGTMGLGEHFTYDDAGNIISLKRHTIGYNYDDLTFHYGGEGNQLLSITDQGDADLYDVIEYQNNSNPSNAPMRYDANGNLVYDEDRGITKITYNYLNLPDTICFKKGHIIVNLYDADGYKFKSYNGTNFATVIPDKCEFTSIFTDSVNYTTREYHGNVITERVVNKENHTDTRRKIVRNAIGYNEDGVYYHYIKNHLGSNCAVVRSENDETEQSTIYYASGVPTRLGYERDKQPYLYGDKEFIEAHGLNEYDSQARMYYATIMRTTTMDPLAEEYYHLSPYSWCGNNPVNAIDPDGRLWILGCTSQDGLGGALKEMMRPTYKWVEQSEFEKLRESNPDLKGYSAILVFEGSRYEFLGWKYNGMTNWDGKHNYGYIDGIGAITADVTLYGPNGPDDITTGMVGFTMSSDFSTFGAIESGDYLAEYLKEGKGGSLPSHWKLSALGEKEDLRWRIPEIDGNLNNSPQAGVNKGKPYKTGIFLHSTNASGWAGITAWNNETGRPLNGVSVGCLLLSPKDFKLLNQKMTGYNSFLVRVIR